MRATRADEAAVAGMRDAETWRDSPYRERGGMEEREPMIDGFRRNEVHLRRCERNSVLRVARSQGGGPWRQPGNKTEPEGDGLNWPPTTFEKEAQMAS